VSGAEGVAQTLALQESNPMAAGRLLRELVDEPGGLDLHIGMFIPTIQGQGDAEQQKYWLPLCYGLKVSERAMSGFCMQAAHSTVLSLAAGVLGTSLGSVWSSQLRLRRMKISLAQCFEPAALPNQERGVVWRRLRVLYATQPQAVVHSPVLL